MDLIRKQTSVDLDATRSHSQIETAIHLAEISRDALLAVSVTTRATSERIRPWPPAKPLQSAMHNLFRTAYGEREPLDISNEACVNIYNLLHNLREYTIVAAADSAAVVAESEEVVVVKDDTIAAVGDNKEYNDTFVNTTSICTKYSKNGKGANERYVRICASAAYNNAVEISKEGTPMISEVHNSIRAVLHDAMARACASSTIWDFVLYYRNAVIPKIRKIPANQWKSFATTLGAIESVSLELSHAIVINQALATARKHQNSPLEVRDHAIASALLRYYTGREWIARRALITSSDSTVTDDVFACLLLLAAIIPPAKSERYSYHEHAYYYNTQQPSQPHTTTPQLSAQVSSLNATTVITGSEVADDLTLDKIVYNSRIAPNVKLINLLVYSILTSAVSVTNRK